MGAGQSGLGNPHFHKVMGRNMVWGWLWEEAGEVRGMGACGTRGGREGGKVDVGDVVLGDASVRL